MTARFVADRLTMALLDLASQGLRVHCSDPTSHELWLSEDASERAVAAMLCLVLGMVVSYARAKAESLDFTANVGIAERAERLVSVLVVTGFTGLGLPPVVLLVTLVLLALASLITVIQRIAGVRRQALAASAAPD